ncbi:MAG: diguanylate cyclase domain-containing protein [Enterocloster sp.]
MINQLRYDRLTGLYTKEFFYQKVRECLEANPEKEYTILCSNFEDFKWYNDTFGSGSKEIRSLEREGNEIFKGRVGEDARLLSI